MSGKKRALKRLCGNAVATEALRKVLLKLACFTEAAHLGTHNLVRPTAELLEPFVRIVQRQGKRDGHAWMQGKNAVDGWPGNAFYTSLWVYLEVTPQQVVARAREVADGADAIYLMDSTTSRAFEDTWDRDGDGGDCSDFIAWCFLRAKSGMHDWKNSRGQRMWVECTNLCSLLDAGNGWLVECEPSAGQPFVAVYPDYKRNGKRRQGHVALINEIKDDGSWWGWDCSSSQGRKGDAIRYRDLGFFKRKDATRTARPPWWATMENAA